MWWFRPVGEEEISSEIGRRPADEISVSEMRVKPNQPGRCHMIGLEAGEIEWVRLLVDLLRRGDPLTRAPGPSIPEMDRGCMCRMKQVGRWSS